MRQLLDELKPLLSALTLMFIVTGSGWLVASCQVPGMAPVSHFELYGAHAPDVISCVDCHGDTIDPDMPGSCSSCHEDARPPDHYTGDCVRCHVSTTWDEIEIDHGFFPLESGHDLPDCEACHAPDDYSGLDAACTSCHESDRPLDHFSGGCGSCHNIVDWADAEFDHRPFFPIPHEGVRDCASCHPDTYEVFVCIDCHEHAENRMNNEHNGVRNYTWESSACLRCHPDGNE